MVEDLRAGFGEIIKCGFIQDATILADVDAHGDRLINPDHPLLPSLVARSIQVKADVVADDFKESASEGLGREILNYGHTLGHAIELVNGYSWRHGEAIQRCAKRSGGQDHIDQASAKGADRHIEDADCLPQSEDQAPSAQ